MLFITNTGNIDTAFDFGVSSPGLTAQLEVSELTIPPHMRAGFLVTFEATAAGKYVITGTASSEWASSSATTTLVVGGWQFEVYLPVTLRQ